MDNFTKFKLVLVLMLLAFGVSLAQAQAQDPAPTNAQPAGAGSLSARCIATLQTYRASHYVTATNEINSHMAQLSTVADQVAGTSSPPPTISRMPTDPTLSCIALETSAKYRKENLNSSSTQTRSADGKITCFDRAGYTLDYDSCKSAVNAYNWILQLEKTMFLEQQIRMDVSQKELSNDVASATAKGEGQAAAYDAMAEDSELKKQLNQEQVVAYSTAVTTLGGLVYKITTVKSMSDDYCANKIDNSELGWHFPTNTKGCSEALAKAYQIAKREVIANEDARGALIAAVMDFVGKGTKAGIAAAMFEDIKKQVQEAKPEFAEDEAVMFDQCALNPTLPACVGPGNRIQGGGVTGAGDFSMGSTDGNLFDTNSNNQTTFGDPAAPTTDLKSNERVAGITSPFKDQAKAANDILNPASAAGPGAGAGGGAPGAGRGGGGGLGGGGRASLGNDLAGANAGPAKDTEVKAKKVGGAYSQTAGAGFQGVKASKDNNENPFASLFGAKGEGDGNVIEEDQSIASQDISGKDSGLFEKISKRYGQIQTDKRIQANNLE
jgi:hypothetical protein